MSSIRIFCDFDGTITKKDTLNTFLHLHAKNDWLRIEEQWKNGEIGSKECLSKQMNCIQDMTEEKLKDFLSGIEIDEYFPEFLEFVKENGIDFCILSDGFDFFIKNILEQNGINGIKIFSNNLILSGGKFKTDFPYGNNKCSASSGVCKCGIIKKYSTPQKTLFYIGDGFSDFCAVKSETADFVFAKGTLLEYCEKNKKRAIGFSDFSDITRSLQEYLIKIKGEENV